MVGSETVRSATYHARMRLPAAEHVIIDPRKLRDYLLSSTHPVGRFKAAFFKSLGYGAEDWGRLGSDLRRLAAREVHSTETTGHGRKYELRGELTGPNGRSEGIVSVWIVLNEETVPRFVTAYPEE